MAEAPNFSARAFPWASLRRLSRDEAIAETVLAKWLAASPGAASSSSSAAPGSTREWARMRRLLRLDPAATIRVDAIGARAATIASRALDDANAATKVAGAHAFTPTAHAIDPYAAACRVVVGGESLVVRGSSAGVRAIVQRLFGGPDELHAPRPLGAIEQSIWSLVVATALEDLGVAAKVWPEIGRGLDPTIGPNVGGRRGSAAGAGGAGAKAGTPMQFSLEATVGEIPLAIEVDIPGSLALRAPRSSAANWVDRVWFDVPVVVGRSAIHRDDLCRLAVRSVVTLERPVSRARAELEIFSGGVGLRLGGGGLAAEVATGYVPRDMSLPDEAHVALTVALGTTQLSLRQITELAVGQIVQLGRPLAGPFELRAGGRVLGRGELVDVDGELAVRIVSLGE